MHVLVTDGEQRAALAAVRSLGRSGHRVTVTSGRPRSLAGASRYAAMHVQIPSPGHASGEYARVIAELVRRHGIEMILPITDESLLALLPARGTLGATIPFPSLEQVRHIGDKERVLATAGKIGVAVPRQWVVQRKDTSLPADVHFPVVVKPHRSVVQGSSGPARVRVSHADDADQLRRRLRQLPDGAFPVLLQQRITGPGSGVFLLRWAGRTIASFSHRRLREKPPSGGVSVYRESVALDPQLLAATERLLKTFDWNGVAMVEYKVDAETGTPYLMEINGRLWGSLQLASDAGIEFPCLLVDVAGGAPLPVSPPERYRVGVRSRWFWGDVDHLLARLLRSRRTLSLPPETPGRLRAIRDFLAACLRPREEEVLRLSDPMPFLRETLDWFRAR